MTRRARASHRPTLTHDLEALALVAGILAVLLALSRNGDMAGSPVIAHA